MHTEIHPSLALVMSDASFWEPDFVDDSSAWLDHGPFAFWLMGALRPRTLVELGAHSGYSYFAFCQAAKKLRLKTSCHAVDTWKGDEHCGFYGEEFFERARNHNAVHYAEFSELIRSTFDAASDRFPDGSIDLLHIDGRHFYEDVKHDFEQWRNKLSDRAVVLFHDTQVREREFGVHQLWGELATKYPSFEFTHCHGLGVLGVGSRLPGDMAAFFEFTRDPSRADEVRNAYARLGAVISAKVAETKKRHHIIISGTGRAGTTFLVQLHTALGIQTGFADPHASIAPNCRAGMELDIRNPDAPYLIKSPHLCDYLDEVLEAGNVVIDHAYVPVRDLYSAAESRRDVERRTDSATCPGPTPGGLWRTDQPEQQETVLAHQLYKLIFALAKGNVPTTLLYFPRLVEDPVYLYAKLQPSLGAIAYERFLAAYNQLARPEFVHSFEGNGVS